MSKFPTIAKMSEYGMTGFGGTNPIAVFECYKEYPEEDIISAMEKGHVLKNPYYKEVVKHGGIKHPSDEYFECGDCGFYSTTTKCTCSR